MYYICITNVLYILHMYCICIAYVLYIYTHNIYVFYKLFFTHRGSEPAQGMPERCVLLDGCSKAFVGLPGKERGFHGEIMGTFDSSNQDLLDLETYIMANIWLIYG